MFSNARLDRFTSQGDVLRVTGTTGHILGTDAFIKRKFKVRLQVEEPEEKETNFTMSESYTTIPRQVRSGHLPEVYDHAAGAAGFVAALPHVYNLTTSNLAINKSIDHLHFYPLSSKNSIDVRPRTQAQLLPYLCEARAVDNLNMNTSTLQSRASNAATCAYRRRPCPCRRPRRLARPRPQA